MAYIMCFIYIKNAINRFKIDNHCWHIQSHPYALYILYINMYFQAAIWHCLNHYAYQDATFLAERLCAEGKRLQQSAALHFIYHDSQIPQTFHSGKRRQCVHAGHLLLSLQPGAPGVLGAARAQQQITAVPISLSQVCVRTEKVSTDWFAISYIFGVRNDTIACIFAHTDTASSRRR